MKARTMTRPKTSNVDDLTLMRKIAFLEQFCDYPGLESWCPLKREALEDLSAQAQLDNELASFITISCDSLALWQTEGFTEPSAHKQMAYDLLLLARAYAFLKNRCEDAQLVLREEAPRYEVWCRLNGHRFRVVLQLLDTVTRDESVSQRDLVSSLRNNVLDCVSDVSQNYLADIILCVNRAQEPFMSPLNLTPYYVRYKDSRPHLMAGALWQAMFAQSGALIPSVPVPNSDAAIDADLDVDGVFNSFERTAYVAISFLQPSSDELLSLVSGSARLKTDWPEDEFEAIVKSLSDCHNDCENTQGVNIYDN